jgi:bacillithiol biosynthesis deacetylase BshB1
MNPTNQIDVLAIGAHPDDVELSAGGTLLALRQLGYTTAIVDLSRGELGSRGTAALRAEESEKAGRILGISNRFNLEIPDGFLSDSRENLLQLIRVIRMCRPKLVLANAIKDRHPDHSIASKLAERAVFLSGLSKIITEGLDAHRPGNLLYYIQDQFLTPDVVVDVTPYFQEKLKAIACYSSQFHLPKTMEDPSLDFSSEPVTPISTPVFWELLTGKAQLMGRYAGYELGEGFIQSRPSGITNLMHLQ